MQISEMRRADALNSEAVLGMMISADSGLEACRYLHNYKLFLHNIQLFIYFMHILLNIYYFIHIFPIALFPIMMYIGKRAVLRGRRTPIITY